MGTPAIRDPRVECMPRESLAQLQLERLQATANRAGRSVRFYRRRFDDARFEPEDLTSLEGIRRLPPTTKEDLRASYPYGMFAVPLREIVRMHMSAGTTGEPTVVGYTANDVRHLGELVARNLVAAGVTREDVVEIFFGHGIFASGFGFHYGAEALGASVLPLSHGEMRRQLEVLRDFRTTVLVGTPGYALQLSGALEEAGIDPHELSLEVGLFGGEVWDERVRRTIEERLLLRAYDTYGLGELGGPGVAFECGERSGLHVAEDQFLVEVLRPGSSEPAEEGEEGELVFTTLNTEGFPLLRLRSGDLSVLDRSPCPCGRTSVRIARIRRHTDERIVVNGVAIVPRVVEAAVLATEGLSGVFQVVVDRSALVERVEVRIQLATGVLPELPSKLIAMETSVRERLEARFGLPIAVKLGAAGSIPEDAPRMRAIP